MDETMIEERYLDRLALPCGCIPGIVCCPTAEALWAKVKRQQKRNLMHRASLASVQAARQAHSDHFRQVQHDPA